MRQRGCLIVVLIVIGLLVIAHDSPFVLSLWHLALAVVGLFQRSIQLA